jgi:hypothetical protein
MMSLTELDLFSKNYLVDWEKRATVRTGKRTRLNKSHISQIEFSLVLKPFLGYPEIQALTPEQLHPFYLQSLCDMLYGVTRFEVDFVVDQCGKLANQELGIELSSNIRQVAMAIGTDEMYHAFAARELLSDIEDLTGVNPTFFQLSSEERASRELDKDLGEKSRITPLEYFQNAVPKKLERIAETTLLCILENAVIDDMFEMAKNFQTLNPVAIYNREHIHDEGRHKVFFQRLLRYIWSSIKEEDRILLGEAIGGYFKKYFTSPSVDKVAGWYTIQLQNLHLPDSVLKSIAYRVAEAECAKLLHEKEMISNPMHLMSVAGVIDHDPTRELFLSLGLISESLAVA